MSDRLPPPGLRHRTSGTSLDDKDKTEKVNQIRKENKTTNQDKDKIIIIIEIPLRMDDAQSWM